jgi:coproporphyrinogen III oxidase-like Fe-S oxidoreductase
MEGIEPDPELDARRYQAIESLVERGLLQWRGPRLSLTDRGVLLSNEVFEEFIEI